ncbi:MAG: HAD-IA family hydrolase, partial [Sandaracinobacter sp.]
VITSSPFEAFRAHEAARGLPDNFIRTVNATNSDSNAWARLERNEIDAQAFDTLFRAEALTLGHDVRGADVLPLLSGQVRPRMVAALDAIKAAGLMIGCITNNAQVGHGAGMAASADQSAQVQAILARFDHVIESSKAGVRKPDPAIYRMMLDALALEAAQCIYLDDLGINCKPAAALGMTAIKVSGEAQALDDLSGLLGLAL